MPRRRPAKPPWAEAAPPCRLPRFRADWAPRIIKRSKSPNWGMVFPETVRIISVPYGNSGRQDAGRQGKRSVAEPASHPSSVLEAIAGAGRNGVPQGDGGGCRRAHSDDGFHGSRGENDMSKLLAALM